MEASIAKTQVLERAAVLIRQAKDLAESKDYSAAFQASRSANAVLLDQMERTGQPTNDSKESFDDDYWMRFLIHDPHVALDSIVLSNAIKESILNAVILPLVYGQPYIVGAKPKKAILLSGPNGCGKTALVSAIANHISRTAFQINLLAIRPSTIMSKWLGESERKVDAMYDFAEKNRPIIIFIDECDSFFARTKEGEEGTARTRNTFLQRMSGLSEISRGIFVVASTNKPQVLDTSFHSRMDKEFCVPLPGFRQRLEILRRRMTLMVHALSDKQMKKIATMTRGYSGRDLEQLLTECQDRQYAKLKHHKTYLMQYCLNDGTNSYHLTSCLYFGLAEPCRAVPVDPMTQGAVEMDWLTVRNKVQPQQITYKDMSDATRFVIKTTTERDMVDLQVYYTEKGIPYIAEADYEETSCGNLITSKLKQVGLW